jgi:hypothetical protein
MARRVSSTPPPSAPLIEIIMRTRRSSSRQPRQRVGGIRLAEHAVATVNSAEHGRLCTLIIGTKTSTKHGSRRCIRRTPLRPDEGGDEKNVKVGHSVNAVKSIAAASSRPSA